MDLKIAELFGQVAGVAGLSLVVFLLLFRDFIRRNIFPQLAPMHAYRLIRLFLILCAFVTVTGIGAWVYANVQRSPDDRDRVCVPTEPPEIATNAHFALIDEGKYSEAWARMAKQRRVSTPRETFVQLATNVRAPLGRLSSRSLVSSSSSINPPGNPKGTYHTLTYRSFFAGGKAMAELVTLVCEGEKWAVEGHLILDPGQVTGTR